MQPRFSVQIVAISLCLTVLACSHVAVDCADWNSKEYFEAATAADVAACIQSGADLKARTEDGWTPLHWAAGLNESPAIITALLDAGADPKARDKDGKTPLHWAAWSNGNPAVIEALLDAGADLKARDRLGKTPWDRAKDRKPLKGSEAYWRLNEAQF